MKLTYPRTRVVNQVDRYHGVEVHDPYRWLEDPDSPEVRAWIEEQNRVTASFLERVPVREGIRRRLSELWDFPRRYAVLRKGGRYFQLRNTGLQNQDVLYVSDRRRGKPRILLDPNGLSPDGTVALTSWSPSKDGRWLAYATSTSGSDWLTWRVRDVDTGRDLPDTIEWSKFSEATWLPDASGFYYARYDEPREGEAYAGVNVFQKLYFHRRGEPQPKDILVYDRPDQKEWGFSPEVSDDGRLLVLHVWQGTDTRNRLFFKDLRTDGPVVELIHELEAAFHFLGSDGPVMYLRTDLGASQGRIIAIDVTRPDRRNWRTLVPEGPDTLEQVTMVHDEFIGLYLHDAHHKLRRFDIHGRALGEIPLPGIGSVYLLPDGSGLFGDREDDELSFAFHSFVTPPTAYRFDFRRGSLETLFTPRLRFDVSRYTTRQVFVRSKDGTRVPMFLVHRRRIARDGRNPTLLYGYGGFNIALTPVFQIQRLVWLELGGLLAVANLRGGGEYGEEWHKAGMLENKQNVFDDFAACARWLLRHRVTSREKLAIQGGSNGGLLVGACMAQHPDLFAAAHAAVGVFDMLRFHKFTIGWAWTSDYGSPDDETQFRTLYAYSPLHNLKAGTQYPAVLLTTGDHDDRVVPAHSFKFAAALQAAQAGDPPALIRIQTKAGHGFGKPTSILIEEWADVWSFLARILLVRPPRKRRRAADGASPH